MKSFVCYLLALSTAFSTQGSSGKQENRPRQAQQSTVTVPNVGQSAFETIVATAVDNRIPIGIVVDNEHQICREHLSRTGRTEPMAEFVNDLEASLPSYTATFTGSVLNLIPKDPTPQTNEFLKINIPQFHSEADSHQGLGINLWMYIRAVIAPDGATAYAGASSTMRETVSGIDTQNQDVRSILNTIVSKGSGGIWVLKSDLIKDLSPSTPRPYEVKGYIGEEQTIRSFECR